jgi:uncharacterized MAPEG superfamily protein
MDSLMTITLWCLFGVLLIPIVLAAIGGYFRGKEFDTVDNKYPRLQASQLTGIGARVYAAQENAWEAAILFTAAALTSHLTGVSPEASAPWALGFVAARVLHAALYIGDKDTARSLAFFASMVCVVALFVQAA